MKSGATESCFYYLAQHYKFPENVDVRRTTHEIIQSNKQYKIIWAHDNCDQAGHATLPQHIDEIDKIVCVSNWEREQYIKYNRAPAEKLTVIPNGVDDMFRPPRKPKLKTCIFFSAPHKGIAPLVPIWKEVIKHHPDAKLKVFSSMSLYGDIQPGEGENETITTENGLEPSPFIPVYKELQALPGVEYSPCIDREELLPHIQDAAFYIHPNVWEETFCVSLAEAMSCGCFPITTDMGALPETSNGMGKYIPMSGENTRRGWIPDDTFHQKFAEEVINALHFFDVAREEYEMASKKITEYAIENYNWKTISQDWSNLIDSIMGKARLVDDDYIFNEVYVKNEYDISSFNGDEIVVDIGAHRGFFTKLCLDKGCKNIHSFEPEPQNFKHLTENLKDYKNFQAYNLAVLDKKGERDFVVSSSWNTGIHSFYLQKGNTVKVKTIGLDDILDKFPKVSLLKIDTEGAEYEILYNSKLLYKVEKIVGEYHDGINQYCFENLKKYLQENNFEVDIIRTYNQHSGVFVAYNKQISQNFDERYLKFSDILMTPYEHIDYLYQMRYEKSIEPKVIYDIGSNCLHWSKVAQMVWKDSKIYHIDGFEPFENLYKTKKVDYAIEVLSDNDYKQVTYFENFHNHGGCSYYELNYEGFPYNIPAFKNEHYREVIRQTKTLDTLVKEKGWKTPDLIKMDVQGCELDIIRGAVNTIRYCPDIILELQNKEYMKGAPMRDEVIDYMKFLGYKLISHFTQNSSDADGDYHFQLINKSK